jgi:hypothetical protein
MSQHLYLMLATGSKQTRFENKIEVILSKINISIELMKDPNLTFIRIPYKPIKTIFRTS